MPPLWLCLTFPQLPLDVFTRAQFHDDVPLAIGCGTPPQQYLIAVNPAAHALGITPGLRLSAAYALSEHLLVKARDELAEHQALQQLALWAMQFTSQVSLLVPQALLLEIRGSLQLFGGLNALLDKIQQGLQELGYAYQQAIAPTAHAAELFSVAGSQQALLDTTQMLAALRKLPVSYLQVDSDIIDSLQKMGVRRCGDLLRLPRSGLQQRFGGDFVRYLLALQGQLPDPRKLFQPPETFSSQVELPVATDNTQALLFAGRRLLLELQGFLISRCLGARELHWQLLHEKHPASQFSIQLVNASRQLTHLQNLLTDRLERLQLPAPVIAMHLSLRHSEAFNEQPAALLHSHAQHASDSWQALVERLHARLDHSQVSGLQCVAEHRPEYAWRHSEVAAPQPASDFPSRPCWLLPQPRPLEMRQQQPLCNGFLRLLQGPERVESGWWDEDDIRRDYYIAENPQGQRFWIFKPAGEAQWFLHGVF